MSVVLCILSAAWRDGSGGSEASRVLLSLSFFLRKNVLGGARKVSNSLTISNIVAKKRGFGF